MEHDFELLLADHPFGLPLRNMVEGERNDVLKQHQLDLISTSNESQDFNSECSSDTLSACSLGMVEEYEETSEIDLPGNPIRSHTFSADDLEMDNSFGLLFGGNMLIGDAEDTFAVVNNLDMDDIMEDILASLEPASLERRTVDTEMVTVTEDLLNSSVPDALLPVRTRKQLGIPKKNIENFSPNIMKPARKRKMSQSRRGKKKMRVDSQLTDDSSGCGTSKSSKEDKREHRNFSQKQRRATENDAFQNLREEVPSIPNDGKTSKIAILHRAADYINKMKASVRNCKEIEDNLREKNDALKKELERLANVFSILSSK